MIDRTLLKDLGFTKGSGWPHEVWVFDGNFWVHYAADFQGLEGRQVDGRITSRRNFLKMFLEAFEAEIREQLYGLY